MMHIFLGSDESKLAQINDVNEIKSIAELMDICKRKFKMGNLDVTNFGFKTK